MNLGKIYAQERMVPLGDRSMISQKSCNWLAIDLRKRDSLFVFFSAKMSNMTSILLLLLFFQCLHYSCVPIHYENANECNLLQESFGLQEDILY